METSGWFAENVVEGTFRSSPCSNVVASVVIGDRLFSCADARGLSEALDAIEGGTLIVEVVEVIPMITSYNTFSVETETWPVVRTNIRRLMSGESARTEWRRGCNGWEPVRNADTRVWFFASLLKDLEGGVIRGTWCAEQDGEARVADLEWLKLK